MCQRTKASERRERKSVQAMTELPKYYGKTGRSLILWSRKFKSWLASNGCGAILESGFSASLPRSELSRNELDPAVPEEKRQIKALDQNAKAISGFALAMHDMMILRKIMVHKFDEADWPSGHFTKMWEIIFEGKNCPLVDTHEEDLAGNNGS